MSKPVITVVGSFAVGMTLRAARMPIFGETCLGSAFDMGPGGKGSNQAVGVARLGADAYFAGIIGQDKLADIAIDLYRSTGVNTTYLAQTARMATGVGFIIVNEAGQNGIILDMGANHLMDSAFVDGVAPQIARSAVVITVLEIPIVAAQRAMMLGHQAGVRTILNPAPATLLPSTIFQYIDYLTPNETELRILMGLAPDDPAPTAALAADLRRQGVKNLIVTRGEDGALLLNDAGMTTVPAPVVSVVDSTGAGDAFNAGLAVALAEGRPLVEAVRFACCAGALACTQYSVIPALPQRAQVEQLYGQTYG